MDYGLASRLAFRTMRWGSCFWICMCECVEIYDSEKKTNISEAICYWPSSQSVCVCVWKCPGRVEGRVCKDRTEIDTSVHPWPPLPIKVVVQRNVDTLYKRKSISILAIDSYRQFDKNSLNVENNWEQEERRREEEQKQLLKLHCLIDSHYLKLFFS